MQKLLLLFFALPMTAFAACPEGYTPQLGPIRDGVARNSAGECLPLCGAMATTMYTSHGVSAPLFSAKNTTPALNVKVGDNICYVDLIPGAGDGINVNYNDTSYHTYEFRGCPATYKLSYSCGADAVGVAPQAREITWGELFIPGSDYGTCKRAGHVPKGWTLDGNVLNVSDYYTYTYSADKTIEIDWAWIPAPQYGIAYTCGTCNMPYVLGTTNMYLVASDGQTVYVSSGVPTGCLNYLNAKVQRFRILYSDGTDTGDTVNAGASFTNNYQDNLRLVPIYDGFGARMQYTLSYSCGDGATGTPPPSRRIKYGGVFILGTDYGTCKRAGYYPGGWKIDDVRYSTTGLVTYTFPEDKTMEIIWVAAPEIVYGVAYVCNNGETNWQHLTVESGQSYTPHTDVCAVPQGKQFAGYEIQYADGVSTGDTVAPGAAFTFNYDDNIRLSAIWQDQQ